MKPKGYILFIYYNNCDHFDKSIEIGSEFCDNKDRLMRQYQNHINGKWDLEYRNKIDYFYLDCKLNRYFPLHKWKNQPNADDKFASDHLTVLSTKYFLGDLK